MKRKAINITNSSNNIISRCKYNTINKSRSKFACKKLTCPYCGPRLQEEKKLAVQNRIEDYDLYNMVTLTSTPSKPLEAITKFKKLMDCQQ